MDNFLGQKTELAVLRYLVIDREEAGVREIARGVKIGPPNVLRALKVLEGNDILVKKNVGRSVLYRLNTGHYLVEKVIRPLFVNEKNITDELSRFVMKNIKFPVESAVLFGSIARGREKDGSDIDVLFIVPNSESVDRITDELLEFNNKAIKYFGNYFSPLVMRRKDFLQKHKAGDQLIENIIRDGLVIGGKLISEIF